METISKTKKHSSSSPNVEAPETTSVECNSSVLNSEKPKNEDKSLSSSYFKLPFSWPLLTIYD